MDCILEAVLTVSPKKQYLGIFIPTIPATAGPVCIPKKQENTSSMVPLFFSFIVVVFETEPVKHLWIVVLNFYIGTFYRKESIDTVKYFIFLVNFSVIKKKF